MTLRLDRLRLRARVIADVRRFFEGRGSIEVETPAIVECPGIDAHLDAIPVVLHPGGRGGAALDRALVTSPELHMKRLLCEGLRSIHQIGKAWRDGEVGDQHEPEFTMLEWYRVGLDDGDLMDETEALVRELAVTYSGGRLRHRGREARVVDSTGEPLPFRRITFREAFVEHSGIDPFEDDARRLGRMLRAAGVRPPRTASRDQLVDLVLGAVVAPRLGLGVPEFVVDWPAERASLAKTRPTDDGLRAARFELFACGMELCNGYWELTDPEEHRARFAAENAARVADGADPVPPDEALLAALDAAGGLPDCAGNALGLDRLLMLLLDAETIREVRTFPCPVR
jgi:lysyl-tRNA synthetase class 2